MELVIFTLLMIVAMGLIDNHWPQKEKNDYDQDNSL